MKHLLLRLYEVENIAALKDVRRLEHEMDHVVSAMKLCVVGRMSHQFEPFGATMIYLLSESHCSAHTFWEEQEVYIDLFCCTDFDEDRAIDAFCTVFQTQSFDHSIVDRTAGGGF